MISWSLLACIYIYRYIFYPFYIYTFIIHHSREIIEWWVFVLHDSRTLFIKLRSRRLKI